MSNGDQVVNTLLYGAALHRCDTVFGNDIINVHTVQGNNRASRKLGIDGRDRSLLGMLDRAYGNDVAATLGIYGTDSSINLSARATVLERADAFRTDLTAQVNAEGTVNGNKIVIHGDNGRIIGPFTAFHQNRRIVVNEVIELLIAHCKYADDFTLVEIFLFASNDTGFYQIHHGAGDHFCMNTKVMLVHQGICYGIRNTADAKLNAVPIIDQTGNILADCHFNFAYLGTGENRKRIIHLDQSVYIMDMNLGIAIDNRKIRVDFKNDFFGMIHEIAFLDQTGGNTHITMLVHGRCLGNKDIHVMSGGVPSRSSSMQMPRKKLGNAKTLGIAAWSHHKHIVVFENRFVFFILHERVRAGHQSIHDRNMMNAVCNRMKLRQTSNRFYRTGSGHQSIPVLDKGKGTFDICQFALVFLFKIHS